MKKVFLILMSVALCHSAIGQISTGNSTSTSVRTGNRAQKGNFGLYVSGAVELPMSDFSKVNIRFLPLVNLKYMLSDKTEFRIGVSIGRYSEKAKGEVEGFTQTEVIKSNDKEVEANFSLYPGIAYHFSNSNILDVYVGAELPLGYDRMNNTTEFGEAYNIAKRTSFNIGVGGFVGLQAYIANLPLALGLEYGIYSRFDFGLKFKNQYKANADSDELITYTTDPDKISVGMGVDYKSLNASRINIGSQVRLTLTYFFNK
jgi:hypothetical protein